MTKAKCILQLCGNRVIHQLFDDALDMKTGPSSKPGSDMHLQVTKLKDAYPDFTRMADVNNIGTLNERPGFKWIWLVYILYISIYSNVLQRKPKSLDVRPLTEH